MSTLTITRADDGLREIYGRGWNPSSDEYKLPADKEEQDRLNVQHRMWKLLIGGHGLYPPETEGIINRLLAPRQRSSHEGDEVAQPAVLDLGCGSGIWAAEMAVMHPNARVVGLDLYEPKLSLQTVPRNCSFVTEDASKGLDRFAGQFDLVHCRCVAGHVSDRVGLIRTIATVLKTGGLILLSDGNADVYSAQKLRISPASPAPDADNSDHSWFAFWIGDLVRRMNTKNLDKLGGEYVGWLLKNDEELEYVHEKPYYAPVNWDGADISNGREIGMLMATNLLTFLQAGTPLMKSSGISDDLIEEWVGHAREEVINPPRHWSLKYNLAWAVKRA